MTDGDLDVLDADDDSSQILHDAIDLELGGPCDKGNNLLVGWLVVAKFATTGDVTTIAMTSSSNMDVVTQVGLAEAMRQASLERIRD